ncbi:MAG: hypothetical protein IJU20_07495 [Clostridia bacterium]|nr:hypothetical protein [Clostridia bacterium]
MSKKEKILSHMHPLLLNGICHRGLHNEQDIENGMRAFENAIRAGFAFELDVHLTRDNELIVCHDSDLKRVTGKEGIIEDMTAEQIRQNYTLLDGEPLPTLAEVFDRNDERVPIVLELKVFRKNYTELAARVARELSRIRDKSKLTLISFDPRALFPFKKSGFVRQLLISTSYRRTWFFARCFEGVDLDRHFFREKKVQRYAKRHVVNCWTIESGEALEAVLPFCDTVTFQHLDPEAVRASLEVHRR